MSNIYFIKSGRDKTEKSFFDDFKNLKFTLRIVYGITSRSYNVGFLFQVK